jgi:hypothetical protein
MKLMNQRKQIAFRVPEELAKQYEKQAEKEGHGTLSGWIVAVLRERLTAVNEMPTKSQQYEERGRQ